MTRPEAAPSAPRTRRTTRPTLAALARRAALAALALTGSLGCDEPLQPYPFYAQRYDRVRDCLDPSEVVDVLNGPEPEPCDTPRCWRSSLDEIFVTTTACEAPPDFVDETDDPASPACAKALAALNDAVSCDD